MKKLFFIGMIGIILYEILKVYFIMPMPGSQRMNSIDAAYFLHGWRWAFRIIFWAMVLTGSVSVFQSKTKWIAATLLVLGLGLTYATNYEMAADTMFYEPDKVVMQNPASNRVDLKRIVIGTVVNGEAKAYPIQFIGYHHQVRDTLGGKPIMVTYCTVCHTGRVFEPVVNGKIETFRLVGMDRFNAMFEDQTTGSWWRQANGEAIVGKLKGRMLPELVSNQTSLTEWIKMHPNTKIMQPDPAYQAKYDSLNKYETGLGQSPLTLTDSLSWKGKSWVVGIEINGSSRAFDWNRLKKERSINSMVGNTPVAIVLAADEKSFFAFEKRDGSELVSVRNDTIFYKNTNYSFLGKPYDGVGENLRLIKAYQEFWHSWKTFHPKTSRY